jgi:hypothetical protein
MFTISDAARIALEQHCRSMDDEVLLPFITWEVLPRGGKWIVGFIERSRLLASTQIESACIDGMEVVIDGPSDWSFLLRDSELKYQNGRYFFAERL